MRTTLLVFFQFILLTTCLAQTTTLIPREVFFDDSQRKELFQLNPEGDQVYYIKNLYQLGTQLFYYDLAKQQEFTIDFNYPVLNFYLFPDQRILLNFRKENGQTFGVYHTETKALQYLEPFAIDKSKIYALNPERSEAVAILVGQNGEKGIYRFDLDNNFTKIRDPEGFFNLHFDKDLNLFAGEKFNENQGKSFYYFRDGNWTLFREYPWDVDMFVRGVNNILAISGDGKHFYFSDNLHADITELRKFTVETKKETIILQPKEADLLPNSITFNQNHEPTSVASNFGKIRRHLIDTAKVQQDFIFLHRQLREVHILGADATNQKWLVEQMTGGANEYYLYHRQEQRLTFLFTDFPSFESYPKNIRHTFTVSSFDKLSLPVNVYLREDLDLDKNGIPDQPLPTILYVHGGPWVGWMNNNWLITRNLQLLANRGYAVIFTEFRGASTYGKKFVAQSNLQWGDAMVKDKTTIAQWAIEKGVADPDKIGIFGWSYGGYAAMAGLAFSPETYACGIAMYGIADLESFLETDFANNNTWKTRVADINTEAGRALAKKHSPINFIHQIKAPLLLSTGGKDRRIHFSQSDKMAEQMEALNKEVGYLFYPEEVHDYRQAESWISFWGFAESFLYKHLGGAYLPFDQKSSKGQFIIKSKINQN